MYHLLFSPWAPSYGQLSCGFTVRPLSKNHVKPAIDLESQLDQDGLAEI